MIAKSISDDLRRVINQYPNTSVNLEEFARYWMGELSDSTIIQYIRYLHALDIEVRDDELAYNFDDYQTTDLEEYLNLISDRTGAQKVKRKRCKYFSYLALKKYLKALGRSDLVPEKPQGLSNPDSKRQTFKLSKEKVDRIRKATDNDMDDLAIIF